MRRKITSLAALALAAPLVLSACGLSSDSGSSTPDVKAGSVDPTALKGVSIAVGSKDFDEQLLLGQLTLQMLKAAGASVTDKTNIQGSTATRKALLSGDIDVYYDYTGTGWVVYLGHNKLINNPQALYDAVKKEDLAQNNLVWGTPAPFNNTYAMAVTQEFADANNLASLSDMATYLNANPDATVCTESEFAARPEGKSMLSTYNMTLSNQKSLGTGVIYQQIDKGGCDFGEVFTTDGRVGALGLVPLEDDKGAFPLYNGAPVVNNDNPDAQAMLDVLDPLSKTLTNDVMATLNGKVSVDGEPVDQVANEYLKQQGFIE